MVEYISRFDQYTGQTSWSDADHRTKFYNGLNEQLKDNLAISNRPITQLQDLKAAAQILDQHMRQCEAEKKGRTYHTTSQALSKDPNAMEVDASCCYDRGSDFSARLLTGYDYGTLQVSSHISHGQSSQSASSITCTIVTHS